MRQSTKLTRAQRVFVENNRLDTWEWLFLKDMPNNQMEIVNKSTGEVRIIDKLTKKIKIA